MRALAAAANMLIAGTRFHVPVGRHPKSPDPQVMVLHIDGDEGGLGRLQSVEGMRASDLRHDACEDFLEPEKKYIGSSRICEPHHTARSDTGHNLKLLQYDSTRFAPRGLWPGVT